MIKGMHAKNLAHKKVSLRTSSSVKAPLTQLHNQRPNRDYKDLKVQLLFHLTRTLAGRKIPLLKNLMATWRVPQRIL
jgi:hypothetical protein